MAKMQYLKTNLNLFFKILLKNQNFEKYVKKKFQKKNKNPKTHICKKVRK